MTDLKRTEQPDLTVDAALELAKTDAAKLAAILRGEKHLPSRWPSTYVRRIRPLRWRWWIEDEISVNCLEVGHALTETWARTRAEAAAKRVAKQRADERAAARRAES